MFGNRGVTKLHLGPGQFSRMKKLLDKESEPEFEPCCSLLLLEVW